MSDARRLMTPSQSTPATDGTSALLDALFTQAPVGLAFWDLELRYRRINAELAAMNGVSVEEHLGRRPSDVLPELGPGLEALFERILAGGVPLRDIDVAGETPSAPGVTRHWLASYFPVRDGQGGILGIAGFVIEKTAEREASVRADEALRRSEAVDAELQATAAASPFGVAFLDRDLRYRRVNEALARMNGRSAADHLGARPEEILGEAAVGLEAALRRVMETREPLELQVGAALPHQPGVRQFEAQYFPVLGGGELLGVGAVVRDVTDRHELEMEQSRLLREALLARAQAEAAEVQAVAEREAAVEARREAERTRARIAFLARADRRMAGSMDWERTLEAVVRSAVPEIADWSALTVVEPSGALRVIALAHKEPERERLAWELMERYPVDPAAVGGTPKVVRTGEADLAADITPERLRAAAQDADHFRLMSDLGVRHSATAPLKTPRGVIGALSFMLGDSGRRFTPEDLDLIDGLAGRAALHLQNARLYTERSHIAQTLQASLRPRALPAIPKAEIAARYLPAGDQNEVGGDFYDVFLSGDGVWTAIVGDVSGKGAEAAAITALARHTLRAASMLHDDPAGNLDLLNRAMLDGSAGADFCTVFYTRVCPGDGGLDFRFSNGGHPAPLISRRDGRVERIEHGRGPLVGGLDGAVFGEGTLRLEPGELLLLYTDGVTEIRTTDVQLGDRELRATLEAHAGASAEDVVAAVERRAVELQSGAPRDDIALVAIKARG